MAQLLVLNGTEKLGDMENVEGLAKFKDNYLFNKNAKNGVMMVIVCCLEGCHAHSLIIMGSDSLGL